jgi:hypothetical protein
VIVGCSHQDCRNASNLAYSWPCLREPTPASPCPEPGNCAAGGKCGEDDAPLPSGGLTGEQFERAVLGVPLLSGGRSHIDRQVALAYAAALRARIDELHDQRHAEARKCDALRAEVERLIKERADADAALGGAWDRIAIDKAHLAAKTEECERLVAAPPVTTISYGCQSCADSRAEAVIARHRADAAIAERDALRRIVEKAVAVIEDMRAENRLHGHVTDASARYLIRVKPEIEAVLAKARAKENA